jgi:sec-independent protein translocase protein TatC
MPGLLGRKNTRRDYSGDPEEFRLTLVEHLEELRDRIIRSITILVVAWVIGWFLMPPLYEFLNQLVDASIKKSLPPGAKFEEVFRNATEPFMLKFRLSFMIGLVLAFPFLVMELWGFIAPGLKPEEQKPFKALAPFSLVLFFVGASFCWVIIPSALGWFASYLGEFKGTSLMQDAGTMIFFILKMMLAFGIGFQLPLIVYALGMLGLLSAETLVQYWRQAATFIFIASAVLTPSNDAFSMLMMAVPLVALFLLSVWFVKLTQKKQRIMEATPEVLESLKHQRDYREEREEDERGALAD